MNDEIPPDVWSNTASKHTMVCPNCKTPTAPYGGFGCGKWQTVGKYHCQGWAKQPGVRGCGRSWYGSPSTGDLYERGGKLRIARAARAFVLCVDERFFCGFGKRGRLLTAWSLAGARLFLQEDETVAERVKEKGRAVHWASVQLAEEI